MEIPRQILRKEGLEMLTLTSDNQIVKNMPNEQIVGRTGIKRISKNTDT